MRFLRQKLLGLGVASVAFLALSAEDLQIDEKELECEQAVAHVSHCCPNFITSSVNCTFHACDSSPQLDISESQCIQQRDCGEIVAAGLCDLGRLLKPDGGSSNWLCK